MLAQLLSKELLELRRSHKGTIMVAVFVVLGLSSPLTAKMMPDIIRMMLTSVPGAIFQLPEPGVFDAFWQFQKNIYQIGALALVLVAMGSIVNEKSSGTIVLLVTKPVPRRDIIVSKFLALGAVLAFSMILSLLACGIYTRMLFGTALIPQAMAAGAIMLADNLAVLALIILLSCVTPNLTICAMLSIAVYLLYGALGMVMHNTGAILPGHNNSIAYFVIGGGMEISEAIPAIAASLVAAAVLLSLAVFLFNKQEL